MLPSRLYTIFLLLLLLSPLSSDGSLLLGIILKIVFLKGALFLGTPMAIGSFLLGQGVGFLGGGLAGSFSVLKAAHKYHEGQKAIWRRPVYHHHSHKRPWPKIPNIRVKLPTFKARPSYGPPPRIKYGVQHRRKPALSLSAGYRFKSRPPAHLIKQNPIQYSPVPVPSYGYGSAPASDYYGTGPTSFDGPIPAASSQGGILQRLMALPSLLAGRPALPESTFISEQHTFYPDEVQPPVEEYGTAAGFYDGPAAAYTGVMTSTGPVLKTSMEAPLARPMGLGEYEEQDEFHFHQDGSARIKPGRVKQVLSLGVPGHYTTTTPSYNSYEEDQEQHHDMSASIAYDLGESSEWPYSEKKQDSHSSAATLVSYIQRRLESKSRGGSSEGERAEAKELINLLRKAYLTELERSLSPPLEGELQLMERKSGEEASSGAEPPSPARVGNSTLAHNSTTTSDKRPKRQTLAEGVAGLLNQQQQQRNGTGNSSEEPSSSSQESTTEAILLQLSHLSAELQQFFTVLSLLDQDDCLQKLVCNVHERAGNVQTEYEHNIIATFRILHLLLPQDPSPVDDPTFKYRLAARLGEMSTKQKEIEICEKYYAKCSLSPTQIIQMGRGVEEEDQLGSSTSREDVTARSDETMVTMPRV